MYYTRPPPGYISPPITPRPLLPIFPPPKLVHHPSPPSPPRLPAFDAPYILSTHAFPAAHLRTTEYTHLPPPPPPTSSKAQRRHHATKTLQTLRDIRGPLEPRASPQVLWNSANRYRRKTLDDSQPHGLTLLFAHANGFPKEVRARHFCNPVRLKSQKTRYGSQR